MMIENHIAKRLAGPRPQLKGLSALVVGMARSGSASVELLLQEGVRVLAYDADPEKEVALRAEWEPRGVTILSGDLQPIEGIDFCIVSPGVPPFGPLFTWLRQAEIPLLGEMELAFRFLERPIIAVTGTNGKTTVVTMIAHILKTCGYSVDLVGNVGNPVAELAVHGVRKSDNPIVTEVSSYQCETFKEFKPKIAVITNLAPDHLDRYPSVDDYYETKFNIAINQTPNEALLMGSMVKGFCRDWVRSRKRTFDIGTLGSDGVFFLDGHVVVRDDEREERCEGRSLNNWLPQQILNALAAVGATDPFGVQTADALHALESFQPLPHRLEYAGEVRGIRCFNDSKATNVHAVLAALQSLPGPIRLIAGGRAKGESLKPLEKLIKEKVCATYLIGESSETFAKAWHSLTDVSIDGTLNEAVQHALRDGKSGDVLLLSPACASWDQFPNYGARGDCFKQAIKEFE